MKKRRVTPQQIANYITNMVKGANKSLSYAISIVEWYTITEAEDREVKEIITKNW